jgi:hypothetical protein
MLKMDIGGALAHSRATMPEASFYAYAVVNTTMGEPTAAFVLGVQDGVYTLIESRGANNTKPSSRTVELVETFVLSMNVRAEEGVPTLPESIPEGRQLEVDELSELDEYDPEDEYEHAEVVEDDEDEDEEGFFDFLPFVGDDEDDEDELELDWEEDEEDDEDELELDWEEDEEDDEDEDEEGFFDFLPFVGDDDDDEDLEDEDEDALDMAYRQGKSAYSFRRSTASSGPQSPYEEGSALNAEWEAGVEAYWEEFNSSREEHRRERIQAPGRRIEELEGDDYQFDYTMADEYVMMAKELESLGRGSDDYEQELDSLHELWLSLDEEERAYAVKTVGRPPWEE